MINRFFPLSLFIVGRIHSRSEGRKGLVIALPGHPQEFSREQLEQLLGKVENFARAMGARAVAMAGVLPTLLVLQGIPVEAPLVFGNKGTLYAITATLEDVLGQAGLSRDARIAILGVGGVGRYVMQRLPQLGYSDVIGVDPRFRSPIRRRDVLYTNDLGALRDREVIVVTTSRGTDVEEAISYFARGVQIVDDTYPPIPEALQRAIQQGDGKVFQVGLTFGDLYTDPPLQGFAPHITPGCLAEALLHEMGVDTRALDQDAFEQEARERGVHSPYFRM